jgi:predicted transcriptional regulator
MTPQEMKRFMKEKNISVIRLAYASGLCLPTVYGFLNGSETIKKVTIEKILKALPKCVGKKK